MLVDLARNDVNRVCDPLTTRVDKLMVVQKVGPYRHIRGSYDDAEYDEIQSKGLC
jgi:anthranilate/para-aminobenzoate synthase component I